MRGASGSKVRLLVCEAATKPKAQHTGLPLPQPVHHLAALAAAIGARHRGGPRCCRGARWLQRPAAVRLCAWSVTIERERAARARAKRMPPLLDERARLACRSHCLDGP